MMSVGIAADHGGFELKERLADDLRRANYEVLDYGAYELIAGDDYPDGNPLSFPSGPDIHL